MKVGKVRQLLTTNFFRIYLSWTVWHLPLDLRCNRCSIHVLFSDWLYPVTQWKGSVIIELQFFPIKGQELCFGIFALSVFLEYNTGK